MNKQEFISALENGLSGLPQNDVAERVAFYSEMLDDKIEEGMSEENAVATLGAVDDVISPIISEYPLSM